MVSFNSKKMVSINFTPDSLNVVSGKFNKKAVIVDKAFRVELEDNVYDDGEILDMEKLAYIIQNELSLNKINTNEAIAVINSSSVIMREATFPKVEKNELDSIISYQLDEYIPVNTEDYVVKYLDLGTIIDEGLEKQLVLLIGIKDSLIQAHMNLLKECKLKPAVMDYEGNAINKLINYGGRINTLVPKLNSVAVVNLSLKQTDFVIVDNKRLKISRIIDKTIKDCLNNIESQIAGIETENIFTKFFSFNKLKDSSDQNDQIFYGIAKEELYEIFERIELILRYYRSRENTNPINYFVIRGIGAEMDGIADLFKEFFDIDSYALKNMENVKLPSSLNLFASAVGGLIRLDEVKK